MNKSSSGSSGCLISIIMGVGTFFVLKFLFKALSLWIRVFGAFGVIILILIIFHAIKKHKESYLNFHAEGISKEILKDTIDEGAKKTAQINSYILKIQNYTVKTKIRKICDISNQILNQIKKNPKCLNSAKRFLNYYLDAVNNILQKYVDLSIQKVKSDDMKESLAKVEELLDTIIASFEKQMGKLLENDVIDLDAEISLLENTIKADGN